jgi:hypothetical protein
VLRSTIPRECSEGSSYEVLTETDGQTLGSERLTKPQTRESKLISNKQYGVRSAGTKDDGGGRQFRAFINTTTVEDVADVRLTLHHEYKSQDLGTTEHIHSPGNHSSKELDGMGSNVAQPAGRRLAGHVRVGGSTWICCCLFPALSIVSCQLVPYLTLFLSSHQETQCSTQSDG